jgi:hypothetical protein
MSQELSSSQCASQLPPAQPVTEHSAPSSQFCVQEPEPSHEVVQSPNAPEHVFWQSVALSQSRLQLPCSQCPTHEPLLSHPRLQSVSQSLQVMEHESLLWQSTLQV